MKYSFFLYSGIIDELLLEVFQLKEQGFGFIGDRCNEKRKVFNDVKYNGFKRFSGVNWSVGSIRY